MIIGHLLVGGCAVLRLCFALSKNQGAGQAYQGYALSRSLGEEIERAFLVYDIGVADYCTF